MPPLESHNQRESEHSLNHGLHARMQNFFAAGQADFATGFPPFPELKLIELSHRTSILRVQAMQILRKPDWETIEVAGGTPLTMLLAANPRPARAATPQLNSCNTMQMQ